MNNKLSVVIISKNEEKRIEECIKSILGWAKEIIVVDDESQDRTREIAQNLGAKVFLKKMENEGAHRNWAYAKATGEWILSLDCDERITDELKKDIDEVLKNTEHTHFTLPFRNFIGDYWVRWGGWYNSIVKLFKAGQFKYEEVEVHPRIFTQGTCGHLKGGDVIHYSYKNWEDFLSKLNKQTSLEALKWYKLSLVDPKKAKYKMNNFHALWRTMDRFIRTYIAKKGYRDGFIGFMVAYFSSMYQMISYAKYRELQKNAKLKK